MNQALSSKLWVLLLVGLLLLSFFWGAVKVFLSPDQLRVHIDRELQKSNINAKVEYEFAETSFLNGLWPELAVVVKNLKVVALDPCRTTSVIKAGQLRLPLEVSSFFKGPVQLGEVLVTDAEFHWGPKLCSVEQSTPVQATDNRPSKVSPAQPRGELLKLQNFIETRWQKELMRSSRFFSGFEVRRLKVFDGRSGREWVNIIQSRLHVNPGAQNLSLNLLWRPGPMVGVEGSLGPFDTELTVNPQAIKSSMKGLVKEGTVEFGGHLDIKTGSLSLNGNVKHFPAAVLASIWQLTEENSYNLNSPFFWLTTGVSYAGHLDQWRQQAIHVDNFKIEGELGQISLKQLQVFPWKTSKFLPFQIELKELYLEELLKAFKMEGPSGILNKYGKLSGLVAVTSEKELEFKGKLEDFELYFSSGGIRGKQNVDELGISLAFSKERVSGLIDSAQIEDGEFGGEVSFNFDRDFQEGILAVKVDSLGFNSSIQELLVGGEVEPVGIFGRAQLREGIIQRWKGYIALPEVEGSKAELDEAKIKIELKNDEVKAKLTAQKLKLEKDHPAQAWLRPLFLEHEELKEEIEITDIGGEFSINLKQKKGQWSRLHGKALSGKVDLSSDGEWSFDKKLGGVAFVDFPSLKLLKWDLSGQFPELNVQPSSQMLKQLAKKDPGLKQPSGSSVEERTQFLKNIVNNIKEQMVETAKKLVPQKGGD